MTIKLVSDLHLEQEENRHYLAENLFSTEGDILILAGDITYLERIDNDFEKILFKYLSDNYEQVFYLPGNKEFHGLTNLKPYSGEVFEKIHSNFFLINNKAVEIGKIKLIFSTLWTFIRPHNAVLINKTVSDFREIIFDENLDFSIDINNQLNINAIEFIDRETRDDDKIKIVITHHAPSQHCANDEYDASQLIDAYMNNLDEMIMAKDISYWLYGHTHFNKQLTIGSTTLLSNQLGLAKFKEYENFNPDLLIEI